MASFYDALVLREQPAFLYTQLSPHQTQVPALAVPDELPMGEFVGGGWVIDVPLRAGLVWSDGESVDAHDVVFTFDTVRRLGLSGQFELLWPGSSSPGAALSSVEATANDAVRFTWDRQPGLAQWQHGVAFAPIFAEHYWAEIAATATTPDDLYSEPGLDAPSFGPMVTAVHLPGQFVRNLANPNYAYSGAIYTVYGNGAVRFTRGQLGEEEWGDVGGEVVAEYIEVAVSDMSFNLVANRDSAAADLIEGDIDIWMNPLAMWPDFGSLRRAFTEAGGLTNVNFDAPSLAYLAFNTRRFPGGNVAFRRAIDCMVPKDFIVRTYLADSVETTDSAVLPANAPWHNPDVGSTCAGQSKGERLSSAIQILTDAGWTWESPPVFDPNGDQGFGDVQPGVGLRGPGGQTIEPILMPVPTGGYDPVRATYSFWIQVYVSELGIPLIASPTNFHSLAEEIESLDWDMYVFGWVLADSFPTHLVSLFHSAGDSSDGGANTSGYSSAEYDAHGDRFLAAVDPLEAQSLGMEMQALIANDVPIIPLYTTRNHVTYRDSLEEYFPDIVHILARGSYGLPGLIKRS